MSDKEVKQEEYITVLSNRIKNLENALGMLVLLLEESGEPWSYLGSVRQYLEIEYKLVNSITGEVKKVNNGRR